MSAINEQPTATSAPDVSRPGFAASLKHGAARFGRKVTTRHGWLGDYDYAWLCTPSLPSYTKAARTRRPPPFYSLEADMPLLLAIGCGLQHALAMLAGLITPPIIFASSLSLDASTSAYMISASLIGCGAYFTRSCNRRKTEAI